jgi:hypothetical protein
LGRPAGDHGACPAVEFRGSCPTAAALYGLCPIAASSKSQSSIIGQVACAGRSSICSSNCEASSVAVTGMDQIRSPLLLPPLPLLDWNLLATSFYVLIICLYFSGSSHAAMNFDLHRWYMSIRQVCSGCRRSPESYACTDPIEVHLQ